MSYNLPYAKVEFHIQIHEKWSDYIPPCNWSFLQGEYYYEMFHIRME